MRRRFSRGKFKKRSVSWIAGVTGFDEATPSPTRLITMAPIVAASPVWGAAITVVIPADLDRHGGEDAVLTRIVGSLGFIEGRRNTGAGNVATGFPIRVVLSMSDFVPAGAGGTTISPFDYCSSSGLGNDDIIWTDMATVPDDAVGAVGQGFGDIISPYSGWTRIDTSAKRKLQEDRLVVLWFQTVPFAGTTALDFRLFGGLRTLLMRPV